MALVQRKATDEYGLDFENGEEEVTISRAERKGRKKGLRKRPFNGGEITEGGREVVYRGRRRFKREKE